MTKFSYTDKTSRLTVRISPELHSRLRDYCISFSVSQSETIKKAIEAYLSAFEGKNEKEDSQQKE